MSEDKKLTKTILLKEGLKVSKPPKSKLQTNGGRVPKQRPRLPLSQPSNSQQPAKAQVKPTPSTPKESGESSSDSSE